MKLIPDCIRDILMTVEETTTYSQLFDYNPDISNYKRLTPYSKEEVMYHIRQCKENNFFINCSFDMLGGCSIIDLSPKAHQFLADIRSDTIWNQTKSTAKKVGSLSLDALVKIATSIVTASINSQLGI